MLEASDREERLQIDWETLCYMLGGGMQRMIPVYGPEPPWIRRQEVQWRLDVADATCSPAVIR